MGRKRILETVAMQVRIGAADHTQRELAIQFGISRGSVLSILHQVQTRREVNGDAGDGPVEFKPRRHYCDECKCVVLLFPCPACVARAAQKAHRARLAQLRS